MKITTPVLLTIITIVDLTVGSKGGLSGALWISYGIYKLLTQE